MSSSKSQVSLARIVALVGKKKLPALSNIEVDSIADLYIKCLRLKNLQKNGSSIPNTLVYGAAVSSDSMHLKSLVNDEKTLSASEGGACKFFSCVLNLDSVSGPGTHWVGYYAIAYPKKWKSFYIDSYGEPAEDNVVTVNAHRFGNVLYWSDYDFQPMGTDACGWYSLYFMWRLFSGEWEKRWDIFKLQHEDLEKNEPYANDHALQKYMSELIHNLVSFISSQ